MLQFFLRPLSQAFSTGSTVKAKPNKAAAHRFRHLISSGAYSFSKSGRNHNFAKKSCTRRTGIRQQGVTEGFQTKVLQRLFI